MPGWNCLKCKDAASARIRFAEEGECRTHHDGVKAVSEGKFGYMHLQSSLAYRQQHGRKDLVANREGTSSIRARGGMRKPTPSDIWGGAPADEGVVPMILLITQEKREGPLGSGGSLEEGTQDIAGNGYSSALEGSELILTCMCASNSGFEAYLKPKGKGVCEMPHLKPERGNLEFRNLRGGAGNGSSDSCLNGMLGYNQAI